MAGATVNINHSYKDLRYSGETRDLVEYQASSSRNPRVVYTVTLDTTTGEAHCQCPAALHGRACWHTRVVALANGVRLARRMLATKPDADLPRWRTRALAGLAAGEAWLAILLAVEDEIEARARREARIAAGHAASDLLAGVA